MNNVLFARAQFELATNYLYAWFGQGIIIAERLGYRVIDLPGDAFTLDNLTDALEKYQFNAIFLGGHGNENTITGQHHEEILTACLNDQLVSGNIMFFLSCFTGQELGPSIITKNGVAYLGYQSDFRFMVDTNYPILEDPLAEPFKDMVVEVISRMLHGQPIDQVWNGQIVKGQEWIAKLWDRPESVWSQVIDTIKHDINCSIALGDRSAHTISPIPASPLIAVAPIALGSLALYLLA